MLVTRHTTVVFWNIRPLESMYNYIKKHYITKKKMSKWYRDKTKTENTRKNELSEIFCRAIKQFKRLFCERGIGCLSICILFSIWYFCPSLSCAVLSCLSQQQSSKLRTRNSGSFLTNCLTEQSMTACACAVFYVAQWGMNMALTFPRFMARLTYEEAPVKKISCWAPIDPQK